MATDLVTVTHDEGVAVLLIDNPPVNALNAEVAGAIGAALDRLERDDSVQAVVVMGAGRTFVAGADLTALERAAWGERDAALDLHPLLIRIEDFPKPVVMALHGTTLGGGLELAMAGHYRVAAIDGVVGQPEVNLGIIPGAEGTQRLPRLVGVAKALDMCVSGRPVKAQDALDAGLVDAVARDDLRKEAVALARSVLSRGTVAKTRDLTAKLGSPDENAPLYAAARAQAAKSRRLQTAPLRAIDAIEAAATLPYDEGRRRERELFFECAADEQAKALIHLFFAERAVGRVRDLPKDTAPRPIDRVAIVGAGTMGSAIAAACANAGLTVLLKESSQEALDRGVANLRRIFDAAVTRGKATPEIAARRLAQIQPQLTYDGFDAAHVVIEAVFENLDLKQQIFRELDGVAGPDAVLASNTSTLDVDAIGSVTSRPASVVGLHFFSPAHIMRLLEVVRGRNTGAPVLATALAFGKRLGKVPVVVANCPGFVGNRMMFPYMYEAQFLVEEGATPAQVDKALTDFGMAMGIFAVDDMAGVDVAWRVRQELGFPGDRKPLAADRLCELGRYGQKTGAGWYRYSADRTPAPDPDVIDLVRRTAAEAGIPQRTFTDEEIVERCIFALINEGARVVEDGTAQRASDVDVIYANGYGFPGWRGGPMFFADRFGLRRIHETIERLHREHGSRWTPAPLLAELAKTGGTFRELDASKE